MHLLLAGDVASLLARVRNLLNQDGIRAYLVGGLLRDTLLQRDTLDIDIDIAVVADALAVARNMADTLHGKFVLLDEENGVARVVLFNEGEGVSRHRYLDLSTVHDGIEADLQRRDFTIDAMAIDLSDLEKDLSTALIDPLHGAEDLKRGLIRAVTSHAFKDDPVRLIRAVRLAAQYTFVIEAGTETMLAQDHQLIQQVAGERIRDELCHILGVTRSAPYITYLDRLQLLTTIIPELEEMKGVEQPKEHFWDVFNHSVQTVAALEGLLDKATSEELLTLTPRLKTYSGIFDEEIAGGVTRCVLLKLAALLHDVAKPETKIMEPEGRARFYGHTREGAQMAGGIMQRLRFGNREIRMVQKMVDAHLRLWQMGGEGGIPTRRAIYRYFRDTSDVSIEIMFLTLADFLATQGPDLNLSDWRNHCLLIEYVLEQRDLDAAVVAPPKLIDGNDLMNTFGLTPGPQIGELLEAVREAQGAGDIASREQALEFVRQRLN